MNRRDLMKLAATQTLVATLPVARFANAASTEGASRGTVRGSQLEIANQQLAVQVVQEPHGVIVRLADRSTGFAWADGPYEYRVDTEVEVGQLRHVGLRQIAVARQSNSIRIYGKLAGLEVEHTLSLHQQHPILNEHIIMRNPGNSEIALRDLAFGMIKPFASAGGHVEQNLQQDRWIAVPFRDEPGVPVGSERKDFTFDELLRTRGRVPAFDDEHPYGYTLGKGWGSEAWAWLHGSMALGIFKFNQEAMEFAAISPLKTLSGAVLRFGGSATVAGNPLALARIRPGASVVLGLTRYQLVEGAYREVCYAFRDLLDQEGARFPPTYDPPVLWDELFDTEEWNIWTPGHPGGYRMTRPHTYTREIMFGQAAKALEYHCDALYFDPGWDTDFGTLLWGTDWLGNRADFILQLKNRFELELGLEGVFATWLSVDPHCGKGVLSWPREAFRMSADGKVLEGKLCMGSQQYLEEALRRVLPHFRDGVRWMMIDGNWYPGECYNPAHGHPVPYTIEDHWRANIELVSRIHSKYPQVYLELHEPVTWATQRYSPIYYKYCPPLSHDENWAFEMMWAPLEQIKSGRALVLYNYNLACNIPLYTTVNLGEDNEHCLALWWFASTCRHLGVGGINPNPMIAMAQKSAIAKYQKLNRFFKRGKFYGYGESVHAHVLPSENAFVVLIFNLSTEVRRIKADILLTELGLDLNRWWYSNYGELANIDSTKGTVGIDREMEPWSVDVFEIRAVPSQ